MSKRVYISSHESDFFIKNTIDCAPRIPDEGDHKVGDLIISSTQRDDIIGWVCVKDGNPGEWEVICDIVEVKNGIEMNRLSIENIKEMIKSEQIRVTGIEQNIDNLEKRVGNNENSIVGINDQVKIAKQTLLTLNNQITRTNNNLSALSAVVESNASSGTEVTDNLQSELANLKELVGVNANESNEADTNILGEINNLKELVGANADSAGEAATGLQKEINDLKEFIGLGDEGSEGEGGNNLLVEINNLKEIVGNNADSAGEAATGLHKEINDLKDFVGLGDQEGDNGGNNLLDQMDQNKDSIDYLSVKTNTITSVDVNSPNAMSYGDLAQDSSASNGVCYYVEAGSSDRLLYSSPLDDIKFGQYGMCVRLKCIVPNGITGNVVRIDIYNRDQIILEKYLTANNFNNEYALVYGAFMYNPIDGEKQQLRVEINVLPNSGVSASFDYIYANMVIPSVFL